MEARLVFLFSLFAVAADATNPLKIKLWFDRPGLRLAISKRANMKCCYICQFDVEVKWTQTVMTSSNTSTITLVNQSNERVEIRKEVEKDKECSNLVLKDIELNDTGLYQCLLTKSNHTVYTPGTYLQVYEPIQMILDISERSKNSLITAEGVLLLLFVLLPGIMLIFKTKGLNQLEKRKGKEEENIYEGLNLDECNSTYHQIQRSLVQGPYQDVINNDEDDIQLEKP
ncbi:hypothetical protein PHYPO_G00126870 [Pangasianodon hypophthalmus]|uniref:Ig-like domain-containing protein n=1 Tax=Pangasianodon hypophthalmus TaxID=310915 RepID=A0A5N5KRJ1_PANHP|nr:B-cell antigen receptor complex-associated protein alpha chain [Pangasianodon hypophthalmus]KAB5533025.1 hypothetical protein PHYPO_G00126870 [Pangasianodon hypophthalmus]